MQTVELTCDSVFDRAIRAVWRDLADGGVASLAHNTHPEHRPHLTLAACAAVPDGALARVDDILTRALPLTVRLSGLLSFSARSRRRVLAWNVVPTVELLTLHRDVWDALNGATEPNPLYLPGRWAPHVGLSRRLEPVEVSLAHQLLGRRPDLVGALDGARSFDSDTQETSPLATG